MTPDAPAPKRHRKDWHEAPNGADQLISRLSLLAAVVPDRDHHPAAVGNRAPLKTYSVMCPIFTPKSDMPAAPYHHREPRDDENRRRGIEAGTKLITSLKNAHNTCSIAQK